MTSDREERDAGLRLRDDPAFRRFIGARLVSLAGTGFTLVAFPVLAYQLTLRRW